MENEEKNKNIDFKINQKKSRNLLDDINKKEINHWGGSKEIIINDISLNNLDRSFDSGNAYMKRKIPTRKSTCNIYKPKKPDIRKRSPEKLIPGLIENNSASFNPNQIINFNNLNNASIPYKYSNKLTTYIKKKSSFNENSNFLLNNSSFCNYTKDNINLNSNKSKKNVNMDIDLVSPLNSSFDAYINMQRNNFNNNIPSTPRDQYCGATTIKKNNNGSYNRATYIQGNNLNNNQNYGNIFTQNENNIFNNELNRSYGYANNVNNNNIFNNNNHFSNYGNYCNNVLKTKSNIIPKNKINNNQRQKYITYNNSPLRKYINQAKTNQENNNCNYNNYQNSQNKNIFDINNINKENLNNNINIDENYETNNYLYTSQTEKNTSINIEDLMILEEKLNEIITSLNRNHIMNNECFEFWNYYYNCSFYGKLEKLFKNEDDSLNVQKSINHILISVMICYDFSFEMEILNNEYSILVDILELNHRNLIIIYEHILTKISSESKSNPWVYKLHNLVNNFNKNDNSEYISMNGRKLSSVEKIIYNVSVIVQNIRVLLKNYKTKKSEYLTSIFKKINDKTYEEINSYFRDNILRVENVKGSVLASVFLKDNECFQTVPAPYIKTKNRKNYSLILDLDETLVHFKVNNEDDTEGMLRIRPGAISFLEEVGKYYELIVFTAATQDYGDLLIDAIEENNLFFEHRFYRQHTVIIGNDFIKDLNRIGRPIDKMIIVDNMPQNFRLQKENGINIKAFWGDDANDNALEELGKILINIAKDGGDVRIGLKKYRDEIVNKVTSNISKTNY